MYTDTLRYALSLALAVVIATGCSREPKPLVEWETNTGLRVAEYVEGAGAPPEKGDIVSIVYTAAYVDGDQFDSSVDHDHPYKFRVGMDMVLSGLDEGVATMRAGGRRVLVLPPHLAFGEEGRTGVVPENAWVTFDVELLEIEPGPPEPLPWNDAGYDIIATPTGLQIVEFVIGEGASPLPGQKAVVQYNAFLDDGTCFDTTSYRGRPIEFEIDPERLIPGILEALLTMQVGGRRKVIIPPDLAYGKKGYGRTVPPDATLIFDLVLVAVRD